MNQREKKPLYIFLLLMMAPLAGIGIDLFVPSLPAISKELMAHENIVKFTIVAYLIGYAIGQPVFGTLSDAWGRKKLLLFGLVFYILASIFLTFSKNIQTMLFLRVLQGIAVAAPGVLSKAILTDVFLGERLGKISTYMTMIWAIGPIIAPVIGGYLEAYVGWRADFYLFAIYGAFLFFLVLFFLKETNVNRTPLNISHLLGVYKKACLHKVFFSSVICISIVYSLIVIFNVVGPFFIETVLGYSPITYGHLALFMGLGFFIGSLANRLLLRRFSSSQIFKPTLYYGSAVAVLMFLFSILFGAHLFILIFFTFCLLIASGIIFPNSMAQALSLFSKTAGTATAIMGASFILGTSIIASLASFLDTKTLIPISLSYIFLMAICLAVHLWAAKKEERQ